MELSQQQEKNFIELALILPLSNLIEELQAVDTSSGYEVAKYLTINKKNHLEEQARKFGNLFFKFLGKQIRMPAAPNAEGAETIERFKKLFTALKQAFEKIKNQ